MKRKVTFDLQHHKPKMATKETEDQIMRDATSRAKGYVRVLLATLRLHRFKVSLKDVTYFDSGDMHAVFTFLMRNGRRCAFTLDGVVELETIKFQAPPQRGMKNPSDPPFAFDRQWKKIQLNDITWPAFIEAVFEAPHNQMRLIMNGDFLDGKIWDRALTKAEIEEQVRLYNTSDTHLALAYALRHPMCRCEVE